MKSKTTQLFARALLLTGALAFLGAVSGCGSLDSTNDSERAWGESPGILFKPANRDDR